jgi:hypothetical protein
VVVETPDLLVVEVVMVHQDVAVEVEEQVLQVVQVEMEDRVWS